MPSSYLPALAPLLREHAEAWCSSFGPNGSEIFGGVTTGKQISLQIVVSLACHGSSSVPRAGLGTHTFRLVLQFWFNSHVGVQMIFFSKHNIFISLN